LTSTLAHGTSPTPWRSKMTLYTVRWTQTYTGWPEPDLDLSQAQELLARIMKL